jgi:O-succinylbenzoate-CoA ligase
MVGDEMMINIGKILQSQAVLRGEKEAFINNDVRITFAEMNRRANAFAHFLKEKGLGKGDKIALLCKNNEDVIATFFGAAKIGVITVVVNWRLQIQELQYIVNHCDAKLVVYDCEFEKIIGEVKQRLNCKLYLSRSTSPSLLNILTGTTKHEPDYESNGDEPILMMYTSGTTGKPKGAMLSHNNLQAASIGLTHTIDWWEQDRFLMVAPFFHIGGFAPLVANVHTGATMVLMSDFDPINAWKLIERERITTMMTVPAMLAFLLKTYDYLKPDLSSIRNITCGASAVPPSLILSFRKLGIPIQQVYGITEYSGAVTFWKESMDSEKYMSMGKPVMQGDLRIQHPQTGEILQSGEIGEITVSGPQLFVGYYKNDEAYKAVVQNDGYYRTGDLGYLDPDGFLYVVDRLKDMIISGGENIYSAELELVLSDHPGIAEVAVVGIPNEKWGEVPRAYVVTKPGISLTEQEVIDFCKEKLASYKAIKEVVFAEQLPRNASGKILKYQLKQKVSLN